MFLKLILVNFVVTFVVAQLGQKCSLSSDPLNPNSIPNPTNCSKFFACGSGIYVGMECPAGLHFNAVKKVCDWPSLAGCSFKINELQGNAMNDDVDQSFVPSPGEKCVPSPIRNNPRLAGYYNDCSKFLMCAGIWMLMSCPPGLFFSVETGRCEYNINTNCAFPSTKCPTNGMKYGDSTDCHKFFICVNGTITNSVCADGKIYNPLKGECVVGPSCNPSTRQPISENLPNCSFESAFYPNYQDCSKFFICNGGSLVAQSCPPNKFFSVQHSNCQLKENAVCAGGKRKIVKQ
ncbi:CLUMA_CG018736, isoform A [Clunio marinus]|uniref:CLUMA_CG018736, isoform A n=1 Tax=Clunio marinus TaxID=568069 RepID=A0A1J1J4B3_9DIPT|nr:CLUMA_CG018736, isoform A [Clunio marinus]